MAGKVQICNMALGRLGANLISSLSEPSKEARLAALFFDDLRDELLRSHAWGFATTRAVLATPLGDTPAGWERQYQVPTDCLRPLFLETASGDQSTAFRIEGDRLFTDLDQAVLVYVRREEDPTRFDVHFTRALASRLAAELAVPVTNQKNLAEAMWQLYERDMNRAMGTDASSGRGSMDVGDSWLVART